MTSPHFARFLAAIIGVHVTDLNFGTKTTLSDHLTLNSIGLPPLVKSPLPLEGVLATIGVRALVDGL